jgi:glycosyltransferase involved in cell wall biosynthesis
MRVAIISFNACAGDAIGNLIAEKVAFFLDRGADVRVFVEDGKRLHPQVERHCHIVVVPETDGLEWQYVQTADLVVVEYGMAYRLLEWLPLLSRAGRRILFDYHGITPPGLWIGPQREALEQGQRRRGLVWFAETALVHSRFTAHELQEPTGFPEERLHVLPHFVDGRRFMPESPGFDVRKELGLSDEQLLLFVGRLAPNKGVPVLVEALKHLVDIKPAVHLAIAGDCSDVYQSEAEHCRRRAFDLGIFDRVHFLGQVSEDKLPDLYRSASVFVMPSRHEGFCIPVLEAMASGLPVIAARAGALPETIGSAGLTFAMDDSEDLARRLRRVLARETRRPASESRLRIAIAVFRYGPEIVGGAEGSLRTMARVLHAAGHDVQVFTTCTLSEGDWRNELAAETTQVDGIPVHRFPIDPHNRAEHLETVRRIIQTDESIPAELGQQYLQHSIHSSPLIDALQSRIDDLDAIVTGPYLFGLTADVSQAFAEKTILVPCFHDEPLACLPSWPDCYGDVGGILYHSPEEQDFAQIDLGLNHPGSRCVGALIESNDVADPARGRHVIDRRYLVYCGRYSQQKNLPQLIEYLERYQMERPGRFGLVCIGRGEVSLPQLDWIHDLGFVDESQKRHVLAGADALVQLSRFESLSLVALEAWSQGTPVIADEKCAPLAGLIRRSHGGKTITDYISFGAALDDLWEQPDRWRRFGEEGQTYVRRHFGDSQTYLNSLEESIRDLAVPLVEKMRRNGLHKADLSHERWRERFGFLVERMLDQTQRPCEVGVAVRPRIETRTVRAGSGTVLVPVAIRNQGTIPVVSEGEGRMVIQAAMIDGCSIETALPGIIVPGQEQPAAVRVPVPDQAGSYRVELKVVAEPAWSIVNQTDPAFLTLEVEADGTFADLGCLAEVLAAVDKSLQNAERCQNLPDEYVDVTQGLFARGKRWIKAKLLGNFKHAYVDVLSRQQSAFNKAMVSAVQELAEGCSLLNHAQTPLGELQSQLTEIKRKQEELECRIAMLQSALEADRAEV